MANFSFVKLRHKKKKTTSNNTKSTTCNDTKGTKYTRKDKVDISLVTLNKNILQWQTRV